MLIRLNMDVGTVCALLPKIMW